jgi:hypothetical protein
MCSICKVNVSLLACGRCDFTKSTPTILCPMCSTYVHDKDNNRGHSSFISPVPSSSSSASESSSTSSTKQPASVATAANASKGSSTSKQPATATTNVSTGSSTLKQLPTAINGKFGPHTFHQQNHFSSTNGHHQQQQYHQKPYNHYHRGAFQQPQNRHPPNYHFSQQQQSFGAGFHPHYGSPVAVDARLSPFHFGHPYALPYQPQQQDDVDAYAGTHNAALSQQHQQHAAVAGNGFYNQQHQLQNRQLQQHATFSASTAQIAQFALKSPTEGAATTVASSVTGMNEMSVLSSSSSSSTTMMTTTTTTTETSSTAENANTAEPKSSFTINVSANPAELSRTESGMSQVSINSSSANDASLIASNVICSNRSAISSTSPSPTGGESTVALATPPSMACTPEPSAVSMSALVLATNSDGPSPAPPTVAAITPAPLQPSPQSQSPPPPPSTRRETVVTKSKDHQQGQLSLAMANIMTPTAAAVAAAVEVDAAEYMHDCATKSPDEQEVDAELTKPVDVRSSATIVDQSSSSLQKHQQNPKPANDNKETHCNEQTVPQQGGPEKTHEEQTIYEDEEEQYVEVEAEEEEKIEAEDEEEQEEESEVENTKSLAVTSTPTTTTTMTTTADSKQSSVPTDHSVKPATNTNGQKPLTTNKKSNRSSDSMNKPCFYFNTHTDGCRENKCLYPHICEVCQDKHPARTCPKRSNCDHYTRTLTCGFGQNCKWLHKCLNLECKHPCNAMDEYCPKCGFSMKQNLCKLGFKCPRALQCTDIHTFEEIGAFCTFKGVAFDHSSPKLCKRFGKCFSPKCKFAHNTSKIVCFVCRKQGHDGFKCPQLTEMYNAGKKHMQEHGFADHIAKCLVCPPSKRS